MIEVVERLQAFLEEGSYRVLSPLIAVCLVMFVLVTERSIVLFGSVASILWPPARRRIREREERVVEALDRYVEEPGEESRAALIDASTQLPTPYGRFLERALSEGRLQVEAVRDLELEEARLVEEVEIERGLGILSVLAKSAPLLGLLGTVIGMIQTFRAMMLASTSDPRALSSGISIALIATEVGLIVALPGVISMSWLSRRAQNLIEEIHLAVMRLRQVNGRGVTP